MALPRPQGTAPLEQRHSSLHPPGNGATDHGLPCSNFPGARRAPCILGQHLLRIRLRQRSMALNLKPLRVCVKFRKLRPTESTAGIGATSLRDREGCTPYTMATVHSLPSHFLRTRDQVLRHADQKSNKLLPNKFQGSAARCLGSASHWRIGLGQTPTKSEPARLEHIRPNND